ncbi:sex comb on midleg-like protein 4 isoform X3 [Bombina bombina]|uniref:sex comb on midleg-like protein 4 isoform X3 n=1 Tax=Bombina bombina TaxID=8345 RepID=UPI00235ACDB6|nr:sex comb on midleg-like protein 4 isoform X3 [Bombina bombina]
MQSPRIPGRKRGRPPLHSNPLKMAVHNLYSGSVGSIPTVKIPKKRGRKPGFKLKSRIVMTPLAISPPRSTPEPDISSIPQDAATVPNSAVPQSLTVCIHVNKQGNTGPYLDRKKVQQLPDHFGPERPSVVLQQAVQACIDCAHQQKNVFSLVKQGYGGEMVSVSASFEGKQHLLSLPVVNSIGYVLRFLKKLCRSLICDNLFSNQPFVQYSSTTDNPKEYDTGRMESAETVIPEDYLVDPVNTKRYNMDPSDSAFNYMGSMYPMRQSSGEGRLGGGGNSSSSCNLRPSQMSSASSPSPDNQESVRPTSKDPSNWSVEDVVWFVKDADPQSLGPHVDLFRKHEIDGNALLLLKSDMVMKYLGLKLGPALKLCYHIDKLKQLKY